jgi:FKBP-type peptidyl-prolyl cis-trans isomerase SlyD
MALDPNKVVTMNFKLTDDEGNVLDSTDDGGPFSYLSGKNMVLPKLEEAVGSMIIGAKKNIKLDAIDAYGEYSEQIVQVVGKENFPNDFEIKIGMSYMASSPDGNQMPFVITEVRDEEVTIDFNHPFAGKNLNFDVELLDIRDATAEELSHGHIHRPDGHHHH